MPTLIPLIDKHFDEIRALCLEYGVARLEVIGSVGTPEFDPGQSDTNMLVACPDDYDFGPWLARLQELEEALAAVSHHDVDLVTTSALNNRWFRREAEKTRRVIYDASQVSEVA